MKYAVAHAPVGSSVVIAWDDAKGKPRPKMTVLSSIEDKEEFITTLNAGDICYLELGGAADRLALACHIRGAKVFRIPVFRLGDDAERMAEADESEDLNSSAEEMVDDEVDEGGVDEEDGAKLAARKIRAERIRVAAESNREAFYELLAGEVPVLTLIVLWKGFHLMQRTRIATHLRLLSVYRDLYLVTTAQQATGANEEEFILAQLANEKSFGDMPVEARRRYLASIKSGDVLEETVTEREKALKKLLERQLETLEMNLKVFDSIPGCGPLITARLIGTISDIRRFPTFPKLKAYFGHHHFADGSRARRRKGKVSNWNQVGKQGVWQWGEQIAKTPAGSNDWRVKLDCRRAYELLKLLRALNLLPTELMAKRDAASVLEVTIADLSILLAAIDGLRGETEKEMKDEEVGGKKKVPYREYVALEYKKEPLYSRVLAAYEEGLGKSTVETKKLMKGIKAKALDKAKRWLRQQFLKHLYRELWKLQGVEQFVADEPEAKVVNG